jgi:hypothetical protein
MTDVGVYMIVHRASGYAYVGQSNNIPNRWMEHTKQLHDGSHHNRNLLNLWQREGGAAFEFCIVCHAPVGLTPRNRSHPLNKTFQRDDLYGIVAALSDDLSDAGRCT